MIVCPWDQTNRTYGQWLINHFLCRCLLCISFTSHNCRCTFTSTPSLGSKMSQSAGYVPERTLNVDQLVQSVYSQEESYVQPLSYSQPRSPTTNRLQRSNSIEQSTLSTPLPQVRRVKPQSMLRMPSNMPPAPEPDENYGDEGYHTGLSEHSSIRPPRSSRTNSQRDALGRTGTIREENRIGTASGTLSPMTDFFSSEVFHIVLHNPATAHRFLKFCQSRACGETIEFLQRVWIRHLYSCRLWRLTHLRSIHIIGYWMTWPLL